MKYEQYLRRNSFMKVCTNALAVKQENNYFSVTTNCTEIRIFFLTDHLMEISQKNPPV